MAAITKLMEPAMMFDDEISQDQKDLEVGRRLREARNVLGPIMVVVILLACYGLARFVADFQSPWAGGYGY
jgi:hypothetical protein